MPITESTARRRLTMHGLRLAKERQPRPDVTAGYVITDLNGWVVAGGGSIPFSLDLDDVSEFLDRR